LGFPISVSPRFHQHRKCFTKWHLHQVSNFF